MEYKNLGTTDIKVSAICLGTMTYGEQNTTSEAIEQLDYAFEEGVNFIDTAEMYPVPPCKETYTKTEQIIGKWEKLQKSRDKVILATKVIGRTDTFDYVRNGKACLNKDNIREALHGSLKRLNVDYIDLYQLHWPDRPTNCFGIRGYTASENDFNSFSEILQVLDEIKKEGKVREFGLSNETPWGTMSSLNTSKIENLPRMQSVQNPYSLLNRTYEIGMAEVSHREKCGLLAYSPLAFGALSGKYLDGKKPSGSRLTLFDRFTRYSNPNSIKATQSYVNLALDNGLDPAQMALAFVNSKSFVTSNIIGATTMEQLKSNIESINIKLNQELLEKIDQIHDLNPNPSP